MVEVPLEIERKYRLARAPAPDLLAAHGARSFRLEQSYLVAPPSGRRIRRIEASDGTVSHRLTRKRHLRDLVREEVETEIVAAEYDRLLAEADPARRPIRKTRYVVGHGAQHLEIDVFDEPPGVVLVEVELASEGEDVQLPEWLGEAVDVSTDPRYANATLALRDRAVPPFDDPAGPLPGDPEAPPSGDPEAPPSGDPEAPPS
jgi:CYTH domain-containing protein